MLPNVLCHPVTEEHVKQSLVTSVEGSLLIGHAHQRLESIDGGTVDEDSGIEAVWPTGIRGCRELFPFKELVTVPDNLILHKSR